MRFQNQFSVSKPIYKYQQSLKFNLSFSISTSVSKCQVQNTVFKSESQFQLLMTVMFINRRTVQSMRKKKNLFTQFPGTNNGMARQSKPGIGIHGPDKIQDHNSSSTNTQGRGKKKQNKKKPSLGKPKPKTIISNSFK